MMSKLVDWNPVKLSKIECFKIFSVLMKKIKLIYIIFVYLKHFQCKSNTVDKEGGVGKK